MDSKVENKEEESKDEVDFIQTSTTTKKEICVSCKSFNPLKKGFLMRNSNSNNNNNNNNNSSEMPKSPPSMKKTSVYGDCELQTAVKSHISALERLHLFHFPLRKKTENQQSPQQAQDQQGKDHSNQAHRPRLIKSSSIARLFGNTYNTKKSENNSANNNKSSNSSNHNPHNNHTRPQLRKSQSVSEKFTTRTNESDEEIVLRISERNLNKSGSTTSLLSNMDLSNIAPVEKQSNIKAIKSLTKGLGKLLRRNYSSVEISAPDPEYKVLYLGNVLTGWAKGEHFAIS
jgi:hypothetical protein